MVTCPRCKTQMEAVVCFTGGCSGHFGEDDRCYCDNAEIHIEFQCPNHRPHLWDEKRKTFVKNKNFCKQENLKSKIKHDERLRSLAVGIHAGIHHEINHHYTLIIVSTRAPISEANPVCGP